jgi:hypothetical protein
MATPKKLTRAEVYKQIDAFRGISNRGADGKLTVKQWLNIKRAEASLPSRRARDGKAMNHGRTRIRAV